jgi:hypothetical protein
MGHRAGLDAVEKKNILHCRESNPGHPIRGKKINWNSGGGVKLGPLGSATTIRPIVPAPGDYDDGEIGGMMIGRGN